MVEAKSNQPNGIEEFEVKLEELLRLMAKKDKDDDEWDTLWGLSDYVVENSTLRNALDRKTAEAVIDSRQKTTVEGCGGYPIRSEKSFKLNGATYSVIAFGCSEVNGGKDALDGIVFVQEATPS